MRLFDFLVELATNADAMSGYRRDPRGALEAAGLSDEEQSVVLGGDPLALRRAIFSRSGPWWEAGTNGLNASTPPQIPTPEPGPTPSPEPPDQEPPHTPEPQFEPQPIELNPPGIIEPPPEVAPPPEIEPEPELELDAAESLIVSSQVDDPYQFEESSTLWGLEGLTVVGVGIRAGLQITVETQLCIAQASKVLYLVADPISETCIKRLSPTAISLGPMYEVGKPRMEIYESMISCILDNLEMYGDLCVAFYGHPGVLSYPARESVRRARATGHRARMLPAISTEDSLFADLGIDIGRAGLQSFEATRFLFNQYNFDTSVGLLLWQVGVLGESNWNPPHPAVRSKLDVLTEYLLKFYKPSHQVFLYHAPEFPTSRPLIEKLALSSLSTGKFISISTLYIPPQGEPSRNYQAMEALSAVHANR